MCFERLHSPTVITIVMGGIIRLPTPRYIPGIRPLSVTLPYPTPTPPQLLDTRNEMSVPNTLRCPTNSENLHLLILTSLTHNHTPLYLHVRFLCAFCDTSRITLFLICNHIFKLHLGCAQNNFFNYATVVVSSTNLEKNISK